MRSAAHPHIWRTPSGSIIAMRIGIFTDHFYPELGGIQDSLEELSRELGHRGHIVHLWAPRASNNDFHILGREIGRASCRAHWEVQ